MKSSYIVLAVPFFVVLIAVELILNWVKKTHAYRLHDTISSVSGGIGEQVLTVFTAAAGLYAYAWLQGRYGLLTISLKSPWAWVAILFLDDLGYYAYHRASHRVNFLWATHIVHHQSEEYNLSTALRQSWFTKVTSWIFYVPLALIGFPLEMWLTMHTFNTLYQFWIHTRTIGSLGPLEWIMNTASHHRVHHGIDPRYIDKNYAGIFIIWDRLFGTFTAEDREPVYGVVKPLASFDPVFANFADWVRIGQMARATQRWRDKLLAFFMPPEWRPRDLGGLVTVPEVSRETQSKHKVAPARITSAYSTVNFLLALAAGVWFLTAQAKLPWIYRMLGASEIILALWTCGALVENKRWAWPLEAARLLSLGAVSWLFPPAWRPVALALCAVELVVWSLSLRARLPGAEPSDTAPTPQFLGEATK